MTVKDPTTGKSGSRMVTSYPLPASAGAEVIHERTGNAPLAPTTNPVFDHAQYSTAAPGSRPAWVPFFKLPAGATLDDEQMCDHDETTATCPPPSEPPG